MNNNKQSFRRSRSYSAAVLQHAVRSFSVAVLVIAMTSCKGNTYAKQLQEEKKAITTYIAANGYQVFECDSVPENSVWNNPKALYKVAGYDYFYYRLNKQGDTTQEAVKVSETIVLRYRKYTLTEPYDTASYWSTIQSAYPIEFSYATDYTTANEAWQVACGLMRYPDAECMIICPSKLGFTDDQNAVVPYGYDLKMKIKR